MSRFLIADASNLIFRGGVHRRKDPTYPTGWSYLLRTVFKHIKQHNPTHVVIAGDSPDSSATRRDILPDYKRNRPECPDFIKQQLRDVHLICKAVNIPFITQARYEADDVINTLVRQAIKHHFDEIHIIADDKDLFTLLDDERVAIHRLTHRQKTLQIARNETIPLSKCNVKPKQMPDFLALVGDPVDNIDGCCCIGVKRAQCLLHLYGSIGGIFNNIENIQSHNKSMARRLKLHKDTILKALSLTELYDLSEKMGIDFDSTRFDVDLIDEQTKHNLDGFGLGELYKFMIQNKEDDSSSEDSSDGSDVDVVKTANVNIENKVNDDSSSEDSSDSITEKQ